MYMYTLVYINTAHCNKGAINTHRTVAMILLDNFSCMRLGSRTPAIEPNRR